MSLSQRFLLAMFRGLTNSVFRIHGQQLSRVPAQGPLIIVMNHINILEIPLIYSCLQPRPVHGLVLADHWKNPILAWGLDACGSIPLERGGANISSFSRAIEILKRGEIVLIMPEGTRSGDGRLRKAYPGVVLLAGKSKAPLLPVITYGGEKYKENLKRLRRTDFYICVGEKFYLDEQALNSQNRTGALNEVVGRMASLLPPAYRGVYRNILPEK